MNDLSTSKSLCSADTPRVDDGDIAGLLAELEPGWTVVKNHHLQKSYSFDDFATGLAFVNRLGAVAEEADHHPDVLLRWGLVRLDVWTHSVGGLSTADFELARRCDAVR